MKLKHALAAFVLGAGAWPFAAADARATPPPLKNPALLNIGFVCRWQDRCIARQQQAMGRALKYVRKNQPPPWKIQLCNRNAGRNGTRVDWVGFNNCVRNASLQSPPKYRRKGG